jgi:CHAT domain-containing protein
LAVSGALVVLGCGIAACNRAPARELVQRHARLLAALAAVGWGEERLEGAEPALLSQDVETDHGAGAPVASTLAAHAPPPQLASALRQEVKAIARQVASGASARDIRDRALIEALAGRLDQAIASLVTAAATTHLAGPPNDLAALYLARARRRDRPEDLLAALEAAAEALRRDPTCLPARFNRALALQRLGLEPTAHTAWQIYSRRDVRSGWAELARLHLAHLERPRQLPPRAAVRSALAHAAAPERAGELACVVARSPQMARELAEGEALAAWAAAWQAGDDHAAREALAMARAVGEALAARSYEHLTADAVAAIDGALAAPGGRDGRGGNARAATLAAGHRSYGDGVGAFARGDFEDASRAFSSAGRLLARGGSPFAARAAYERARCIYSRSDYPLVLATLEPLLRSGAANRSPALRAGCLRLRGLIRVLRMDPAGALADLTTAAALFGGLGEAANSAAVHILTGTALDTLGDSAAAWKHLHLGLVAARAAGDPAPLYGAYGETVVAALRLGHPLAALAFAQEYVEQARRVAPPPVLVGSLLLRATCQVELHDAIAADADVREARPLIDHLEDPGQRQSLLGDFSFVAGRAARLASARGSLRTLDEAVAVYEHTDYHLLLAALLAERARAHLAVGDEARAEADLAAAIGERERQRRQIPDAERRIGFFARDRALFDEMIALQLRRHRADLALEYAERGRARVLLDAALGTAGEAASGAPPLRAGNLAARLPRGVTLIEYQLLEDRALAWCARRGSAARLQILASTPADLTRKVAELRRALRAGDAQALAAAPGALYEALLAPLLAGVPANDRLVLVPDGALHELPFPLLREPRTGRWLIASHVISLAPSAALYLRALDRDRQLARLGPGTAAAVLDPAFDAAVFPALARLPSAAADARAVARLGLPLTTLSGADATADRFLAVASQSTVVHFGGHALLNQADGMLSALALAPGAGDSGALYARDLWRRRLERTRLVVLAACEAMRGRELAGEGAISLGRAFLAAGVPAVVASVVPVPDTEVHAFFDDFYSRLAAGDDAATALTTTQLACLQGRDGDLCRPEVWGQFELIGAAVSVRGSAGSSGQLTSRQHLVP